MTQHEVAEGHAVDAKVHEIMRATRTRGLAGFIATPEFIREGAAYMEKARRGAVITLLERIARNELIDVDELMEQLSVRCI